jgi:hypothetical protein
VEEVELHPHPAVVEHMIMGSGAIIVVSVVMCRLIAHESADDEGKELWRFAAYFLSL